MTKRTAQIDAFLDKSGWVGASREALAADASTRSYDRLFHNDGIQSAVLMKTPPQDTNTIATFVKMTEILRGFGLSAPEVFHQQKDNGLLMIEDLGDALLARICDDHQTIETELYSSAIDLLVELQRHPAPDGLPAYDMETYLRESRLLTQWYLPAATGAPVTTKLNAEFDKLICQACKKLSRSRPIIVLRDYHAENLFWLPDRRNWARIGLIDYQDALAGHPAYDLVSLLEDARRDVSTKLAHAMLKRFLGACGRDKSTFERDYSILGMQRNLKIIGIFTRLFIRDGKFSYLDLLPRVWQYLQRDLSHPELSDLHVWVQENVPEPNQALTNRIRENVNAA